MMTLYNASKIITTFQVCVFVLMIWNLELYIGGPDLCIFFSSKKLPKTKEVSTTKWKYIDIEKLF